MGLPLFEFLNTKNKVIYPDNAEYKTLFPETTLLKEIQEQIINEYYSRLTSEGTPQGWLRRWHNLIKRRAVQWNTLLASETALRADDAIYNYDMVEESTDTGVGNNNNTYNNQNKYNGTDKTNNTSESYQSDTPDGSLSDIVNYMSAGAKDESSGTATSENNNTSNGENVTEYNQTVTHKMTRKGNIGVMTSAQIIGGYRDAVKYSAYSQIFSECEQLFIGVFEGDDNGYLYTTY